MLSTSNCMKQDVSDKNFQLRPIIAPLQGTKTFSKSCLGPVSTNPGLVAREGREISRI